MKAADDVNEAGPQDSVGQGLTAWMAELPGVDRSVEAARQRAVGLARLLERSLASIAARHDITLGDWEALSALQRSGPPYEESPKRLAEAVGVTSGTMSVRIERLTHAGLIEAASSRADGRSRPVRLTERGRKRWRAATAERTATERVLVGGTLSADELEQLNSLLAKLLRRSEEAFGPAPQHGPLRADER